MLHSSTAGSTKALMALAASCFAGTGAAHADVTSYQMRGLHQVWPAQSGVTGWHGAAVGSQLVLYVEDKPAEQTTHRETTDQEHLIAVIRHLQHYKENWDGEGAKAPIASSLRAASDFVCRLPASVEMPEPLLHASGNAALAWSGDGFYGEVEFLAGGSIAYYFAQGASKHKGVVAHVGGAIPPSILVLLPVA